MIMSFYYKVVANEYKQQKRHIYVCVCVCVCVCVFAMTLMEGL